MNRGQISLPIAVISAMGMIVAAAFTSWATAQSNISAVNTKVDVVQEREGNHYIEIQKQYAETQKQLSGMDQKLDLILGKRPASVGKTI